MHITSHDIYHSENILDYLKENQSLLSLKSIKIDKGQSIMTQGQHSDTVFFIVKGTISLSRQTSHGRRYQIGTYAHNGFLGLMELFSEKSGFYSVYAETTCDAYLIDGKAFTQQIYQTPKLAEYIFKHITTKWYLSVERMTRSILHSIKYCIIDDLLDFDRNNPDEKYIINKSLECERLGTTVRVYSRILKQLHDAGAIIVERRHIRVINRKILEQEFDVELDK
ncbi:Crp/Fnr family transcriptional regulator [Photobacterium makurazakiensis]|uniref:Crp/Fnr family transcriptional regulator n=1 Tax=Photobacterium makurazakiensis TaxID=2910234 RepID=UPI003D140DA6